MTKALRIAGLFLLLAGAGVPAARAQAKTITGEAQWGHAFQADLGAGLTLDVSLLGDPNGGQNGIYVSIFNTRLPKEHQFVVLPELWNGHESNFIGVFVTGTDPGGPLAFAAELRDVLDRAANNRLALTYFTQIFGAARLEQIEQANLTLGYHGRPEAESADARKVLDSIAKKTGVFTLLEYRLSADAAATGVPHITSIRFSFEPEAR